MLRLPRSLSQTLVGFVALAHVGCSTTIAAKYPHLDRRSVCLLVPGIERDATEFVFTEDNVPISNLHPEIVDQVAPTARTVFEYDPNADPDSVRYLPAPFNGLQCPEGFSVLPSREAQTTPLPEASVDLLVHERRPERVPVAVSEKLANCASQSSAPLQPRQYTATLNVYVTNDGQAVSAFVVESTLGDRKIERCIVNALRTTLWPKLAVATTPVAYVTPSAPAALKAFLAQPAPAEPVPNWLEESGIRRIQPQPRLPPASNPGGIRPPGVFVVALSPVAAAAAVFGIIFFWSANDAPAWASEFNPITGQPYTSLQGYEAVQRLSPQQIFAAQRAHITATQPQAPPASTPTPSPQAPPQPAPQKQPECPRNERFIPERTDNSTGCFDKKGNLQCYSRRHHPCAGVHTHGIFTYQKMHGGKCVEIEEPDAVRCEGPFKITGRCGSVSTTTCGEEGTATSGIYRKGKRLDTP